jgi:phosphate:Na+ symporter
MRATAVHIIFNVLGVLLWIAFIPEFANFVRAFSPASADLTGTVRLAAETPRQIANAHTLFNVANAFLFIWFTVPLSRLVAFLIPAPKKMSLERIQPLYLNDIYLGQPGFALDQIKRELNRLGDWVVQMVKDVFPALIAGTEEQFLKLQKKDEDVDNLHGEIITFLGKLSSKELAEPQSKRIYQSIATANYFENLGDVVESLLVVKGLEKLEKDIRISQTTLNFLKPIHEEICWTGDLVLKALLDEDTEQANAIIDSKNKVTGLIEKAQNHLAGRLTADESKRLDTFRFETDVIDGLRRMHTLFRRIARIIADR